MKKPRRKKGKSLRSVPKSAMKRVLHVRAKPVGQAPGTLTHHGAEPDAEKPRQKVEISYFSYSETHCEERHDVSVFDALCAYREGAVAWINVEGVHDERVVQVIGNQFNIHSLTMEDILHTDQRPKYEDYGDYIFVVLKMIRFDDEQRELIPEQVAIVLMPGLVLSFQETPGDVFDPLRARIRAEGTRIRRLGADYLAYALMDAIVDHYFVALERLTVSVEGLETEILDDPQQTQLRRIQEMKGQALLFRRAVWPLREVFASMDRIRSPLIGDETRVFLRDVQDHSSSIIERTEMFSEVLKVLMDLYLTSVSHQQNQVTNFLTLIATIFLPLTFIAGVYGMNFENMPELTWKYGYAGSLVLMGAVALGMMLWFKKKGWL